MEILVAPYQEKLRNQLSTVEQHVAEGEARIARRRELVEQLEGTGADSESAQNSLKQFEELQKLHLADRDRLRNELRLWEDARGGELLPITESLPVTPSPSVAPPLKDKNDPACD